MYKRHVAMSLILLILGGILSAVLANIDPFQTNYVWANFIVLFVMISLGVLIALGTAVVVLADASLDDSDYFGYLGSAVAITAIGTGVFCSFGHSMMNSGDGDGTYIGLMWAGYGLAIASMVLVGLVSYLVEPTAEAASRSNLRRIA